MDSINDFFMNTIIISILIMTLKTAIKKFKPGKMLMIVILHYTTGLYLYLFVIHFLFFILFALKIGNTE